MVKFNLFDTENDICDNFIRFIFIKKKKALKILREKEHLILFQGFECATNKNSFGLHCASSSFCPKNRFFFFFILIITNMLMYENCVINGSNRKKSPSVMMMLMRLSAELIYSYVFVIDGHRPIQIRVNH